MEIISDERRQLLLNPTFKAGGKEKPKKVLRVGKVMTYAQMKRESNQGEILKIDYVRVQHDF